MEETTNQETTEVKEVPVQKKPKNNFGKIAVILGLIVIALLLVTGTYYIATKNSNNNKSETKTSTANVPTVVPTITTSSATTSPTKTPKITPTPTPTSVFKFGFKKGIYVPYEITLEKGWRAVPGTNNNDTRMNLIIDNNFGGPNGTYYGMTLSEDLSFTSSRCVFPGETATGTDKALKNFVEIPAGLNTFRRGAMNIGDTVQLVCQKQIAGYENPTQFGNILFNFPKGGEIDADIVIKMDKMISSIRATQ